MSANNTTALLAESSTTDIGNTDAIVFNTTAAGGEFDVTVDNNTGSTIRVVFHTVRLKV